MTTISKHRWVAIAIALLSVNAAAQSRVPIDVDKARVIEHWTPERRAAAIPRDLVIDPRGFGYLRRPDGSLRPYGHSIAAQEAPRSLTPSPFGKPTGGGSGGTGNTIANAQWTTDGVVQTAAGRIYFYMPEDASRKIWIGYVCSGTVATDGTTGRSLVLTAAHCVYDDVNNAFAHYVMFIPDQAHTTSIDGTDRDCSNDPKGCWIPSFGVVDVDWTIRTFPNNIAWDYAFYVVSDTGAHQPASPSDSYNILDLTAGSMELSFSLPYQNVRKSSLDFTHALGYSYDYDPMFMYCAEDMTTNGSVNWWLSRCGLSGGSSGGPWVQPMNTSTGNGKVISVNSWGYTTSPGMAGPKLSGTSASNIFAKAKCLPFPSANTLPGDAGVKVSSSTAC